MNKARPHASIIGESDIMVSLFDKIEQVADHDVPVLIEGESGTGKEVFARAIHYTSKRRNNEFVVINCSAFPDNLLESELFGHMKGAFTGAIKDKQGLFELADNGTFFLDEIGDMSPALQVKLLRVVQEGTFLKLGGVTTVKVNLRIIAATNKCLAQMVKDETFREDLFYRINVVNMLLPPLRARRDDIPLLVDFFLEKLAEKNEMKKLALRDDAMQIIQRYDWPGNVRQLENEIEKATIFAKDGIILPENISTQLVGFVQKDQLDCFDINYNIGVESLSDIKKRYTEVVERKVILEGLKRSNWNKTACADLLKISRGDLMRKIAKFGFSKPA